MEGWVRGGISLVKCAAMLSGCIAAAFLLLFPKVWASDAKVPKVPKDSCQQLIQRTLGIVLVISLLAVLALAIELKDRWFQPVVFLGAIWAALRVRDRVTLVAARRFFYLACAVIGVVLIVLPGIPLAAAVTKRPTRLNAPYSNLCQQLKARVGEPAVIVSESRLVGGNLRLRFSRSTVIAPEYHDLPINNNVAWLVVWDASKKLEPGPSLTTFLAQLRKGGLSNPPPAFVEAPYKYTNAKRMRLGYFLLEPQP
jgi:hypothetical protein